ncbi:hypothetical protein Tco_0364162 [Tanacetum coccineum]
MHRNIAWDKVENPNPQSTPQTLPSFEEYTPPVTYPKEVEKTLGTLIEVEPLNEIKLEEVGLNCNHNIPLSSREASSFDGLGPQPLLNNPSLDESLGYIIGPKPHSLDSSRMKIVDYLTTQTPPSPHVENSHPKGVYSYYNPEPGDGVTIHTRRRHTSSSDGTTYFKMASACTDSNADLEDSFYDGESDSCRTLGDYPDKPRGYRNTIRASKGNKQWGIPLIPGDTIRLVQNGCSFHGLRSEDPNQHLKDILKLVDSLDLDGENRERTRMGLVSEFMASQDAILSKFEAYFKQQQNEMTNKINTVLKAITDRIAGTLPSDTVKNPKLGTYPVSSARSYPTMDPQCFTQIYGSINTIIIYPKQPKESQVNRPEVNLEEENSGDTNSNPHPQPNPFASIATKQVRKLNSMLELLGLVPQSSNMKFICSKEDDGKVMFIEVI